MIMIGEVHLAMNIFDYMQRFDTHHMIYYKYAFERSPYAHLGMSRQ